GRAVLVHLPAQGTRAAAGREVDVPHVARGDRMGTRTEVRNLGGSRGHASPAYRARADDGAAVIQEIDGAAERTEGRVGGHRGGEGHLLTVVRRIGGGRRRYCRGGAGPVDDLAAGQDVVAPEVVGITAVDDLDGMGRAGHVQGGDRGKRDLAAGDGDIGLDR